MSLPVRYGLIGALLLVVVVAIGGWGVWYFGLYNVGADDPHWTPVRNFLGSTMDRSVAARDGDIVVPPLSDPQMIATGAAAYDQLCTGCHLSPPGMTENKLRAGMYPKPPSFAAPPPRKSEGAILDPQARHQDDRHAGLGSASYPGFRSVEYRGLLPDAAQHEARGLQGPGSIRPALSGAAAGRSRRRDIAADRKAVLPCLTRTRRCADRRRPAWA